MSDETETTDYSVSISTKIPDWVIEDDNDEEELQDQGFAREEIVKANMPSSQENSKGSPLEKLAPDLSAVILQHLTVQEIATASTISKALLVAARNSGLWKLKFESRWNLDMEEEDWYQAYRRAYENIHDLWMTHWNCVYPDDGLSPGRCCIHDVDNHSPSQKQEPHNHLCPSCRYLKNPSSQPNVSRISTIAQAVAAATTVRLQQSAPLTNYCPHQARRSFANASTLHRTIDTEQYKSRALNFLKDLLFFQIHDGRQELKDLKHLFPPETRKDVCETAMHSWHLAHFSNPDYNRPLVWRISIQRPDCFTVFPSEGYLQPGESRVVVFGVRPMASLLAHATQQLDVHREGVDEFWANVYTEEAHLPAAPFLIHYHFASVIPCRRADDVMAQRNRPRPTHNHHPRPFAVDRHTHTSTSNSSAKESPWQGFAQPQQPVRTMCLSAHVNANYPLYEFQRTTLAPFAVQDPRTLVYVAPQLLEKYPAVWKRLDNLALERDGSPAGHTYRTEAKCQACNVRWGARMEELGQAHVLAKLECQAQKVQRNERFDRICQILRQVVQHLQTNLWNERHHQLVYTIHSILIDNRGAQWISQRQREVLLEWEILVDDLCLANASDEDDDESKMPWRHVGVYRNNLCTDSVLTTSTPRIECEPNVWKEEPKYLEAFAHLAHSPGCFCLGPQEDPNHLQPRRSNRFGRRQKGCATDMFMDDPISGLQSALCVLSDPRSLLVHGIYDRVPYPGSIVRRPKLPFRPPLRQFTCNFEFALRQFINNPGRLTYFQLQNGLDTEALLLIDSWCANQSFMKVFSYPLSLHNYLKNIPPPGTGRFPLSKEEVTTHGEGDDASTSAIVALEFEEGVDPQPPFNMDGTETSEPAPLATANENVAAPNFNNVLPPNAPAGPRMMNLLWVLSAYLGWTVDDNQGAASVYVDRRILIGAQWLSISLMAAPLFWTLFARYARWIPTQPIDYILEGLPFGVDNKMRFLTERECGYVCLILVVSWVFLGRWIERYTSRDFFRTIIEQAPFEDRPEQSRGDRVLLALSQWCQRRWDAVCPLFLQRLTFTPQWNRRTRNDIIKHLAFWRSRERLEQRAIFQAIAGRGLLFFDSHDRTIDLEEESSRRKPLIGVVVAIGSFSASSPHFFLNLLTIFSCSISLGLSMSFQSLETGRSGVTFSTTGSAVKSVSLVTIVILAFLVGQLVGSSGGVLFLAEFVVTSISLILGGAGTMSMSTIAMESWGTFFCLSVTAFWGYIFGRVAVMEGIRQKHRGFSSICLCISLCIVLVLWLVAFLAWKWENPVELMILRPGLTNELRSLNRKYLSEKLQ